ncbi:hypothetical protein PoB_005973100 [Plakobranchus ocellatus]|uniref:Uncharacterized protein n=1 Tax=Plakobranchus ocellatus TaxID=259542 RepID=A0AAV4CMR4_9GAST|nr:hypothetical protein PoB_005973100 [Plakobranchus ocellatus]
MLRKGGMPFRVGPSPPYAERSGLLSSSGHQVWSPHGKQGVDGPVDSVSALRAAGTLQSRVQTPPAAPYFFAIDLARHKNQTTESKQKRSAEVRLRVNPYWRQQFRCPTIQCLETLVSLVREHTQLAATFILSKCYHFFFLFFFFNSLVLRQRPYWMRERGVPSRDHA